MPLNFESRVTRTSQIEGFSEVRFTLNKMSEGRRIRLRLALANPAAKLRDLMSEADAMGSANQTRATALYDQAMAIVEDEITPAWVRWGLHSIEGLLIDGELATVETLIESGPAELYKEIARTIQTESGLSEKERGEFGLPTTSGALAAGQTNDTSAVVAAN